MNGAIKITRTPGWETDKGDFEFRVTVPKESVAAFFAAFPGFELDLIVPQAMCVQPESRHSGMDCRNPDCRDAGSNPSHDNSLLKWAFTEEQYQSAEILAAKLAHEFGNPTNTPTQSLSMQGWDSAQVGMTIAPNADVLNLCRLPTFQEYALTQLNKNASEIEDIDLFAFDYALRVTGKDICSITAEDYLQKLFLPFSEWMRGR